MEWLVLVSGVRSFYSFFSSLVSLPYLLVDLGFSGVIVAKVALVADAVTVAMEDSIPFVAL